MAINVEVAQFAKMKTVPGGFPSEAFEYPAASIANVSAAGETAVSSTAQFVRVRNRTGGDSVYVLFRAAGSTAAAVGNSHLLAAGSELIFGVPKNQADGGYEVDIRATA